MSRLKMFYVQIQTNQLINCKVYAQTHKQALQGVLDEKESLLGTFEIKYSGKKLKYYAIVTEVQQEARGVYKLLEDEQKTYLLKEVI